MKKTMRFLCMSALAMVGAVMTGCSSDGDEVIDNKVVTLTTTIGFDDNPALTRALSPDGRSKYFTQDDKLALVYQQTSGSTDVVENTAIQIQANTSEAHFNFDLTDWDNTKDVTYIYPAAMANKTNGSVDYSKLASQGSGTLDNLASNYDLCTLTAKYKGSGLPGGTLENQLAILAIKLQYSANDITNSITSLTINDGTNNYSVSPSGLSRIYVAIQPATSATINVTASDGINTYTKELSNKTYEKGTGHNVTWNMTK